MRPYFLTPAAVEDVRRISAYIARDSAAASKRVLSDFRKAMRMLGRNPGIGHVIDDLADEPLRFWPGSEVRPIEIIRVIHGAQDVQLLLDIS